VGEFKGGGQVAFLDGFIQFVVEMFRRDAQEFGGRVVRDGSVSIAQELVKNRFCIAEAAFGDMCNEFKGGLFNVKLQVASNCLEFCSNLLR